MTAADWKPLTARQRAWMRIDRIKRRGLRATHLRRARAARDRIESQMTNEEIDAVLALAGLERNGLRR